MSRRVKAAKTVSLILALALTAAFFGGCVTEDSYTPELPVSYDKPPAPSEDAGAQGRFDAKLYYIPFVGAFQIPALFPTPYQ